ncbi:MAG TPA: class I SAM-dependent methyltransferase [Candidatus Binatia bacterium]|jgi:2-polyprenyl-6-hydroxyphenyl methylase/3-demethylubiquinone-9 3-methyltransferase
MAVFDFGRNWESFSDQRLAPQTIDDAVRSLQSLLERDHLQGMSFLDVGCGSGLFSIAAHRLGAARVVGIDISPRCVAVSRRNLGRFAPNAAISFDEGSALDPERLAALGTFDVVYAWGSLHHTGAMWSAIANAAKQVAPGGTLVLAIYNKHLTSPAWREIKRFYNRAPGAAQYLLAIFFAPVIYVAKFLVTGRNPLHKERGMDFWHDVIDWIGGFPYEYAPREEVEAFMKASGFRLRRAVPGQTPIACNEFVFQRTA